MLNTTTLNLQTKKFALVILNQLLASKSKNTSVDKIIERTIKIMENTRTKTRKLTLDEYIDLLYILKKNLWSIEAKIDAKKESMQKIDSSSAFYSTNKSMHDLLVNDATKISSAISTIEENSLSLWADKESGQ